MSEENEIERARQRILNPEDPWAKVVTSLLEETEPTEVYEAQVFNLTSSRATIIIEPEYLSQKPIFRNIARQKLEEIERDIEGASLLLEEYIIGPYTIIAPWTKLLYEAHEKRKSFTTIKEKTWALKTLLKTINPFQTYEGHVKSLTKKRAHLEVTPLQNPPPGEDLIISRNIAREKLQEIGCNRRGAELILEEYIIGPYTVLTPWCAETYKNHRENQKHE